MEPDDDTDAREPSENGDGRRIAPSLLNIRACVYHKCIGMDRTRSDLSGRRGAKRRGGRDLCRP